MDAANITKEIGTSTLVLLALDPHDHLLHTNNLGDSGYLIMRNQGAEYKIIFKSKEQTHSFNFPV